MAIHHGGRASIAPHSPRYEPGPTGNYGADGIPREGMAETYATAMWRDDPSAFWLHPEGPLSDTTPDEYFVPMPEPTARDMMNRQYAAQGMLGGYQQASAMAQYQHLQNTRNAGLYGDYSAATAIRLFGYLP